MSSDSDNAFVNIYSAILTEIDKLAKPYALEPSAPFMATKTIDGVKHVTYDGVNWTPIEPERKAQPLYKPLQHSCFFDIPVEWETNTERVGFYAMPTGNAMSRVTKLRCECGKEIDR